jgi:acetyltransferase-like isoleucine patch superfamily enzyme
LRGLIVRRHFDAVGVLACRGGGPRPVIENDGRLEAENITLFPGVRIEVAPGATASIGKGTYLNRGVTLVCDREVRIGRNCSISWDVVIMDTDQHVRSGAGGPPSPVVIEDDVWIGCRAIILKGVRIGRGAVIGAGAIVTRDVPAGALAVGQPARVLRLLDEWRPGSDGEAQVSASSDADGEEQHQPELTRGI